MLDPPRSGAGREVDRLAGRGRGVAAWCTSVARPHLSPATSGSYRGHGYTVEKIKVFDAFPLTHHTECIALLTRAS